MDWGDNVDGCLTLIDPMPAPHLKHWPKQFPQHLTLPDTSLWANLAISAWRFPRKPVSVFFDTRLDYEHFVAEAEALAGYLQHDCGVARGDRVLLDLQNSPQFVLA